MDARRRGRDEARRAWPWALEDDAARTIRTRRPAEDWLRQTVKRRGADRPRRLLLVADDGTSRPVDAPLDARDAPSAPRHEPPPHATGTRAQDRVHRAGGDRRTVQIRTVPSSGRNRPRRPRTLHERAIATGPDRAMLWAVLAGIFIVLVAAASAHAAAPLGKPGARARPATAPSAAAVPGTSGPTTLDGLVRLTASKSLQPEQAVMPCLQPRSHGSPSTTT
jgi:hypothetical protein